jgi:ABC-type multidrug transport system fused ATPase/permease subunit
MFEGTVRANLDPLQKYSDSEIWEVIFLSNNKTLN